jgi:hypothetical protein
MAREGVPSTPSSSGKQGVDARPAPSMTMVVELTT